jgi:acetyl esterase/lipase
MISEHDRQILSQLPDWNPTGDAVAQRRAWEELATVYNQDLPAIGGLEQNIELRPGLRADIAVPKGAGRHPVVVYLHGVDGRSAAQPPIASWGCSLLKRVI